MNIKQFKNGNFNIKRDKSDDYDHLVTALHDSIEVDFTSYDTITEGYLLYNYNTGFTYLVSWNDIDMFDEHKTVKLIAHPTDIEELKKMGVL